MEVQRLDVKALNKQIQKLNSAVSKLEHAKKRGVPKPRRPNSKPDRSELRSYPKSDTFVAGLMRGALGNEHYSNSSSRLSGKHRSMRSMLEARFNPFNAPPAGSFRDPVLPSMKVKVMARGIVTSEAASGYGAAEFIPSISNTQAYVFTNSGSAALNSAGTITTANFLSAGIGATGGFASSAFTSGGLEGRVNSTTVRIRNVTPMNSRGGTVAMAIRQDGQPLYVNATNINDLIAQGISGNWKTAPSDGGYAEISWTPADSVESDYANASTPQTLTSGAIGPFSFNIGFYFNSPPGVNQIYEWEYVSHGEVVPDSSSAGAAVPLPGASMITPHEKGLQAETYVTHVHRGLSASQNAVKNERGDVAAFVHGCVETGRDIGDTVQSIASGASQFLKTARTVSSEVGALISF